MPFYILRPRAGSEAGSGSRRAPARALNAATAGGRAAAPQRRRQRGGQGPGPGGNRAERGSRGPPPQTYSPQPARPTQPAQPSPAPARPTPRPRGQGLGPGRKLPRKFLQRRKGRGCGTPPAPGAQRRGEAGGGRPGPSASIAAAIAAAAPVGRRSGDAAGASPASPRRGGWEKEGGREGSGGPPAPPGAAATRGGKRGGGEGRRDEEEGAERSGACGELEPRCGRRRRRLPAPMAGISGGHRGPSSAPCFPPCAPGRDRRPSRPGQRLRARTGGRGEEPGGPRGAGLAAAVPPPRRCAPKQHGGGVRGGAGAAERETGLALPRGSPEGGRLLPALGRGDPGRGRSGGAAPPAVPCRAGELGEPLLPEKLNLKDSGSGARRRGA